MDEQGFDPVAAGAVAVDEPPFDPTAHGAVPVEQPQSQPQQSTSGVGAFFKGLNLASVPLDIVKSLTPALEAPSALKQGFDLLRGVPVEKALPEDYRALVGIEKKPLEERIKTGLDVVTQLAFLKAGVEGMPGFKAPTLAETAGIAKPDIAQPVEPVATDTVKTEPIAPVETPKEPPSEPLNLRLTPEQVAEPVSPFQQPQPVPAATEATTGVFGKQEPVAETTAAGTGEAIVAPANKYSDGSIAAGKLGQTHANINPVGYENEIPDTGWVTNTGRYVDREEGYKIAKQSRQISEYKYGKATDGRGVEPEELEAQSVEDSGGFKPPSVGAEPTTGGIPSRGEIGISQTSSTTGEPNAIQEQSAGSILQHPQESVGTAGGERVGVEPGVQGETPAGTRTEGVAGATPQEVTGITQEAQNLVDSGGVPGFVSKNLERIATENGITDIRSKTPNQIIDELKSKSSPIPKDSKVTLNVRNTSGKLVPKEMDAREAEGIFTKEKSSYQALLNCLGA